MELTFSFEQILAIGMFCIAFLGFLFGAMKFFNAQLHSRISKVENYLTEKIENIEENYAQRSELTHSVENVKEILNDMKGEYRRNNDRMDDILKWMIENMGKQP